MTNYIIRRLILLPVILFGVTLLIFGMISFLSAEQRASLYVQDIPKRPGALDKIIEQYGLDDPAPVQYGRWMGNVAKGNLGFSKTGKQEVVEVLASRLPATVELALWSFLPIALVGVQLGILAALKHNRWPDQVLRIFSIIGTSTPSFMAGLVLLMVFAAYLGWLPVGDRLTPEIQRVVDGSDWNGWTGVYTLDAVLNGRPDVFWDAAKHLFLPVLALSYISWAVLLRITRSSMLEALGQEYVQTARAKGLTERAVIQKHALPNAMLPVVTVGGFELVALLNGAVVTETVFNWPGIGRQFVQAAVNLDIITVLGFVLFSSTVLIIGNLAVDILYAWLDPRVRLS